MTIKEDFVSNGKNPSENKNDNKLDINEYAQGNIDLDDETKQLLHDPEISPKLIKIISALNNGDVNSLKKLAIERKGLLTDHLRRKIWPLLLNLDFYEMSPRPTEEEIKQHPSYTLVVMDVQRSLKRFPPSIEEEKRLNMLDELVHLIMRVLIKNPNLNYYQGFHDICITFLFVLGEEHAFIMIEKLAKTHFKIFLEDTMGNTMDMLSNVFLIVKKENRKLFDYLIESDVGILFGLSWLITWFGHVLTNYEDVVRLFDFFIVSHFAYPIYIIASCVLTYAEEILKEECNMACLHSFLSTLPHKMDLENQIVQAKELFDRCPPEDLHKMQQTILKETGKRFSHCWYTPRKTKTNRVAKVVSNIAWLIPRTKWTITLSLTLTFALIAYIYQLNRI